MDIVLMVDKIDYVLTKDRPQNASVAQKKWDNGDKMAKCYILASMSNMLQHRHHKMVHSRAVRISTLRKMLNTKTHD